MLEFLKPLIDSTTQGLDSLFTSDKERLEASEKLKKLEVDLEISINNHMNKVVDGQRTIIEKEMGTKLGRVWRPILMLVFTAILTYNYLLLPFLHLIITMFDINVWVPESVELPAKAWGLLQLGVSGYIVGRSVEKSIDKWKK